jgi:hypothetical protein
VGALAFAWMLLLHAPAELLYAWFAPKAAAVTAIGLQGSLDEGDAAALDFGGRARIVDLHWRFQPWRLPLLRCAFGIEGTSAGAHLSGRIEFSASDIALDRVQTSAPIKAALTAAGLPFVPVDGLARLDLQTLVFKNGFPAVVEGSLEGHGLAWLLTKEPVSLGDFKLGLSTDKDGILGHLEPLGGPLDLSGDVRLQADRSYDYDLKLKARSGADPALTALLQPLGQQDTQGYYHLRNRGKLAGAAP